MDAGASAQPLPTKEVISVAKYILKRVLRSIITMLIIIIVIFSLLRLMPIEGYFENYDKLSQTQIDVKLTQLGLKDPLPKQLWRFLGQLAHGDLGVSNVYRKGVSINTIIAEKIPISLQLGLISLCISLALGLPLGILMARSTKTRFKIGDRLGTLFIVLIQAVPSAAYHILIQFAGSQSALKLPMLFTQGDYRSYLLPIFSLSIGNIAYYAMWLRRYMVDESNKDYIRLARAKGVPGGRHLPEPRVPQRHRPLNPVHPQLHSVHPHGLPVRGVPVLHPRHGRPAGHRHQASGQHAGAGAGAGVRRNFHSRPAVRRHPHGHCRSPDQLCQKGGRPLMKRYRDQKTDQLSDALSSQLRSATARPPPT